MKALRRLLAFFIADSLLQPLFIHSDEAKEKSPEGRSKAVKKYAVNNNMAIIGFVFCTSICSQVVTFF